LRVDLPGFGNSPFETNPVSFRGAVRDVMDAEGIARAALVGVSLGGNTALGLTRESPERVSALGVVGAGLPDHAWSQEVTSFFADEEAALERGDLDAAVEANLRMWFPARVAVSTTWIPRCARSWTRCRDRPSGSRRGTTTSGCCASSLRSRSDSAR